MGTERFKKRVALPGQLGIVIYSSIGFASLSVAAGVAYTAVWNLIEEWSRINFQEIAFFAFAFFLVSGVFFFIGWIMLKDSQERVRKLISFPSSSIISKGSIVDRGKIVKRNEYRKDFVTYWLGIEFHPEMANQETNKLLLKFVVSKKNHDKYSPGDSVKIRYDSADPYMAVLEDEEWSSDHIDPRPNFIFWVGATTLVGLFAAYLAGPLATEEPLLAGALTGLLIAQVQWLVIFRYIYLLNWRWVLAGILGWMVYFKLIPFYGGILGAGIFSLILWLALRKSNQTTRWWFLFSFLGLVAAQWIRTALAPFTSNVISEGIFYLAYGAASGAGLLLNNDSTPTESKLPPLRSAQQMYPAGETNADQEIQDKSAEPSGSLEFESNYRKKGAEIFELIVNGKLVTKQPDENVIRETLLALQQQKKGFCILSQSELTYIQTAHRSSLGFNLEYQDGSLEDHYACTQAEILLEDVHKAFLLFLNQDEQLETLFTWERMQI